MKTDELIDSLTSCASPISVIRSPSKRTMLWLVGSAPYVIAVVAMMTLRPDIIGRLASNRFLFEQAAALTTSISAAYFALSSVIPANRTPPLIFLIAPLGCWIGSLIADTIAIVLLSGMESLSIRPDFFCIPGITMVSAFPAILITIMLQAGAPLTPKPTVFLGALAASALGNFGLRFFHMQDSGPMVLIWQIGTVALISFGTAWLGERILNWQSRIDKAI